MAKRENIVVGSKVKAFIKSKGCMTRADSLDALNDAVYNLLQNACKRAKDNKRSTVRPHDL